MFWLVLLPPTVAINRPFGPLDWIAPFFQEAMQGSRDCPIEDDRGSVGSVLQERFLPKRHREDRSLARQSHGQFPDKAVGVRQQ